MKKKLVALDLQKYLDLILQAPLFQRFLISMESRITQVMPVISVPQLIISDPSKKKTVTCDCCSLLCFNSPSPPPFFPLRSVWTSAGPTLLDNIVKAYLKAKYAIHQSDDNHCRVSTLPAVSIRRPNFPTFSNTFQQKQRLVTQSC